MHEVKIGIIFYVRKDGVSFKLPDLVPAHVGYLQTVRKLLDPAGDNIQAFIFASLLSYRKQHLQADADGEERPSQANQLFNSFGHA